MVSNTYLFAQHRIVKKQKQHTQVAISAFKVIPRKQWNTENGLSLPNKKTKEYLSSSPSIGLFNSFRPFLYWSLRQRLSGHRRR